MDGVAAEVELAQLGQPIQALDLRDPVVLQVEVRQVPWRSSEWFRTP